MTAQELIELHTYAVQYYETMIKTAANPDSISWMVAVQKLHQNKIDELHQMRLDEPEQH